MLTENPENLILKAANNWSIEITPNASKKIEDFSTILEKNTTVNVTFLPNTHISETIETSKKLFPFANLLTSRISFFFFFKI